MDKETEEGGIPEGEEEGSGDTITASPWGTQESGVGGLQVDVQAGRSNNRKPPSAAVKRRGCGAIMGRGRGKEKKRRPVGKCGSSHLGSDGKQKGPRGFWSESRVPQSEGGRGRL